MTELHSLLLSHEARLLSNHQLPSPQNIHITTNSHNANSGLPTMGQNLGNQVLATQQFPTSGQYQGRGRGRNFHRGRGRGRTSTTPKEDATCQICLKWGHTTLKCYRRFDISFTASDVSAQPPFASQSHQALVAEPTVSSPSEAWILDSGATTHVTPDINCLTSYQSYPGSDKVFISNGSGLCISHTGTSSIPINGEALVLNNILCVTQLTKNLLSISQLTKDNLVTVEFTPHSCFVKDQATQTILLHGTLCNGLYRLVFPCTSHQVLQVTSSPDLWHSRLAHCSVPVIKALSNQKKISMSKQEFSFCSNCNKAKAHKLSFTSSTTKVVAPLHIIHIDLWGPSPILSQTGNRYYVLFTDEYSRYSWIYFRACKSEVSGIFARFKQKVENLLNHKIRIVQCDGGTEYKLLLHQFPDITFPLSCPYTPQQNGVAERKYRHVVELGLASMYHAFIPLCYWDTVFDSVLFVINRLPTGPQFISSPFEALFQQQPDYRFLHTIGCECFPLLRPYNQHKLQPRVESCVFFGLLQLT
jgi:GAG-pre-integrase domain